MRFSSRSSRLLVASIVPLSGLALAAACATSTTGSIYGSSTSTGTGGSLENTTGGGGSLSVTSGGSLTAGSGGNSSGDSAARPQRCDDAGCTCFNIASVGYGGRTGAGAGMGGTDSTTAFIQYINNASSAMAAQVGCGTEPGCTSAAKPDLTDPNFLPNYDVLIFQWMANSLAAVDNTSGNLEGYTGDTALGGGGYWTFSQAELDALKAWVMNGGGVIILSGYDYCPGNTGCSGGTGELGPTNQIVQALTDMSYTATNTFDVTETTPAEQCLAYSNPVTGWKGAPDTLGENITAVGALYGRTIMTGSNAVVDCTQSPFGTCAAHEDIGNGHVYVYTDEWVTYTSQWNPPTQPNANCVTDGSTSGGAVPAVQSYYQVPQFWYNAISYASQATMCKFMLAGTIPR